MACKLKPGSQPRFSVRKKKKKKESLSGFGLFNKISLTGACRIDWVVGGVRRLERSGSVIPNSATLSFIQTPKKFAKNKGRF